MKFNKKTLHNKLSSGFAWLMNRHIVKRYTIVAHLHIFDNIDKYAEIPRRLYTSSSYAQIEDQRLAIFFSVSKHIYPCAHSRAEYALFADAVTQIVNTVF